MLLTKGAENRLRAHIAKLNGMRDDLEKILKAAEDKLANASKAWRKSDTAEKFSEDIETVEFLRREIVNLMKKIEKEIADAALDPKLATAPAKSSEKDEW